MFKYLSILFLFSCAITTPAENIANNNISYGAAKKNLVTGSTTQSDVLKLFGNPDNMTFEKDGEIWVYSRFKVESSSDSTSSFGNILLAGARQKSNQSTTSVKTLTILLEFDGSGTLKDFSMRTGGY